MLATVSELSMFQSKALKMQQEKEEKEAVLDEAIRRYENGLPPTDDSEREWDRMERNRDRSAQQEEERRQRAELEAQLPHQGVKTTAIPRPNSYLKADLPRPYGRHQPFKPSEPGASMRHTVNPTKKETYY